MKVKSFLLLSVLTMVTAEAFSQVKSSYFRFVLKTLLSDDVPAIGIEKAAANPGNFIFLDTREVEEFNVSHIPNALFAGYKNFNLKIVDNIPKDKPMIVYCSVGKRSETITTRLKKQGFTNVQNLYGGIFEWINQGNLVHNLQNNPTGKVHAYNRAWGTFLSRGEKVYE